jgi:predicted RNase H-like nuclease (RuvC/YqgF family)
MMCKGYSETHQVCGHFKRFVVTDSCIYGVTEQGQCVGNYAEVLHTKNVPQPSLCRSCHQREERNIIERYEKEIRGLEARIESLRWNRRAEPEAAMRADMRAEVSRLEERLGDARDEKSEQLNEFRTLQGVWGDG